MLETEFENVEHLSFAHSGIGDDKLLFSYLDIHHFRGPQCYFVRPIDMTFYDRILDARDRLRYNTHKT